MRFNITCCDWCGCQHQSTSFRDVHTIEVDGFVFDLCPEHHAELAGKLKQSGHRAETCIREALFVPAPRG